MSKSSRKGHGGELEWAALIGGKKLSRLGYEGPDVEGPPLDIRNLRVWEVKRRELPNWFIDWLDQMVTEEADALAFRVNRGIWFVLTQASRLVKAESERVGTP